MPKFFPQVFITGIALFLLLAAAGYGITTLQARSIPWDCSDWQAFAHSDRTTSILESLAANRGKTLYCAIDQSDTFTKAETWEAGRDRNERDDTIYSGERGIFRGFIAAQEGWLTDGESGVTGVSIDRIFEFPREEKKRRRKPARPTLRYGKSYPDSTLPVQLLTANPPDGPTTGYLIWDGAPLPNYSRSPRVRDNAYVRIYGPNGASAATAPEAQANARAAYLAAPPSDEVVLGRATNGSGETLQTQFGLLEIQGGATEECQHLDPARGYTRATKVKWWWYDGGDVTLWTRVLSTSPYVFRAYRTINYTAFCRP